MVHSTFRFHARKYASMLVVLVLGSLLSAGAYLAVSNWEKHTLELEFSVESKVVYNNVLASYRRLQLLQEAMHGLFSASDTVTRREFHDFSMPLERYFKGIQGIAWVPRVPHEHREGVEADLSDAVGEAVRLTEIDAKGKLRLSADKEYYYPVFYVEPFEQNKVALGFDVSSNMSRWEAMSHASMTGKSAASRRVELVKADPDNAGIVLANPVYGKKANPGSAGWSSDPPEGYILLALTLKGFIDSALEGLRFKGVGVYFSDLSSPPGERFLYGWLCDENSSQGAAQGLHVRYEIEVGQRLWEMICVPLPEFYERFQTRYALTVAIGMAVLTLLLAIYAYASAGRTEKMREQVRERTAELSEYVRQINCLYGISSFIEQSDMDVGDVLEQVSTMMPTAFSNPFAMRISISNEGDIYGRPVEGDGDMAGVEDIFAPDKVGELRVGCSEAGEGRGACLTDTEQALVKSVAAQIGAYLERKGAERKLLDARDKAQQATRAKSEFLANMSHEIRTPLNAIIGLSEMVRKTGLTPKQLDYYNKIEGASRSLLGIVNDILDFSRIEAGKLVFDELEFDLAEVVGKALELHEPRAANKGIRFNVITEPGLPDRMVGDALRLEQVLTNLLTNAIKFTEQGEVELRVLPVRRDSETVRIRLEVRDTGIGISPEDQERLFEAFTQADGSYTRQHGGTGLGLTITRQLVQLMHGEIAVESAPGRGSTFSAEVEFKAASDADMPRQRKRLVGRKALLLGQADEETSRLQAGLEAMGFDVTRKEDGQAVMELLMQAAQENPFELLWTGWKVLGGKGLEWARELRKTLPPERVPRMVLACGRFTEDVRKSAGALFDKVLLRPVSPEALARVVDEQFGLRDAGQDESNGDDRARVRGARILVAEDNAINRQVMQELLEDAGIVVSIAVNGREAVDMVRQAGKDEYDAALMDIQMPLMDGLEATRAIREIRTAEEFPIIAMTAHAMTEDRDKCFEAGMNDYVSKPLDVKAFFKVLSFWVEGRDVADAPGKVAGKETVQPVIPPLDGFDTKAGLERLGGKAAVYQRLLFEFSRDYADIVEVIRQLMHDKDWQNARNQVHTVKGVSGNIGAVDVHAASVELEQAIKAGIPCGECLDSLGGAMRVALASLDRYRHTIQQQEAEEDACNLLPDAAKSPERFAELYKLLLSSDFKAVRVFEEVRESLACSEAAEDMPALEEGINSFDFRGSADRLKAMLDKLDIRIPE